MARSVVGVLALVALLALAATASAASITWAFTGVVREATQNSLAAVGDPVVGFVRFESDTPDSATDPARGFFLSAVEDAAVSFPGGSLGLPFPHPAIRRIDIATDLSSVSGLETYNLLTATGLSPYLQMALELSSHDPSSFDPSALPLDPPSLAALDPYGRDSSSAWGQGTALRLFGPFNLLAELTSLVRVPEPHVAALLLVLAAFTARRPRVR